MFGSPADMIARAIVFMIAMAVHEFAHAYGAYLMGDTTAQEQGRMTLNPLANIYWPGFIIAVLGGPAILGSAPVNPYRMRNRRWGMFVAVLAGPVSNLIVAALVSVLFRLRLVPLYSPTGGLLGTLIPTLPMLLVTLVWFNIVLFLFNLLPLYPLDGWTVWMALLPPRPAVWMQRHQQESTYVLFGLILLSFIGPQLSAISPVLGYFDPLHWLIGVPGSAIFNLMVGT